MNIYFVLLLFWIQVIPVNTLFSAESNLNRTIRSISKQILKEKKIKGQTIAISPFFTLNKDSTILSKMISDKIITQFTESKKVILSDSKFVYRLIDEMKLESAGFLGPKTYRQIGKFSETAFVLAGSIQKVNEDLQIEAKLFNTETGKLEKIVEMKMKIDSEVTPILSQPVPAKIEEPNTETNLLKAIRTDFPKLFEEHSRLQGELDVLPGSGPEPSEESHRKSASIKNSLLALENLVGGNVWFYLNQYERAAEYLSKSIELNPRSAETFYNRALTYGILGKMNMAISDYDKAIALNPELTFAYYNRGILYYKTGSPSQAIADYDKAISLQSKLVEIYRHRADSYGMIENTEQAIKDYNYVIQLRPKDYLSYLHRGIVYHSMEEHRQALKDFNDALAINSNDAGIFFHRALAYGKLGYADKEMADYNQAISLNPKYSDAYTQRGISYYVKGNTARSIDDYNKAIELNAKDSKAYYNRGIAYDRSGKSSTAKSDFQKACDLGFNPACDSLIKY